MRVLLVNPFYPISETPSPPLGLAYLAAALQAADVAVRVLDLVVTPCSEASLAQVLEEFRPDLAGLTAVSMTVDHALAVAADVKRLAPHVFTVLGGPHATFCAPATLESCPALDAVVLGEGEDTLVDLCRTLERGEDLAAVAGIVYRRGPDIRDTPGRGLIDDLDRLPMPARRRLPLGRYRALGMPISMTTSRGCPHACTFCVGRRMVGARVRFRSPVRVVDELEALARLGFHQINLADDLFTADRRRCAAVCDEILRRGLSVKWTSFARVDTVSEELLVQMRAAGCTAVSFGVESANAGILKTIRKGIRVDQVADAVGMCARAGVTPLASFILGLPGETPETIRETMQFAKRLEDQGLLYGFHLLAPFPGTEVRERAAELGLRILSSDWSAYHANRAVAETESVSRRMLDEIAVEWEDRYNRYLGDIRERMQRGTATADETYQVTNLERIVCTYDLMMKGIVERAGTWPEREGSVGDAERVLVERVQSAAGGDAAAVRDAIEAAIRQDHLICERGRGQVRWRWRDELTH